MTWEEYQKQRKPFEPVVYKEIDVECPICGKKIRKRIDMVVTTYPQQYRYECSCGWSKFGY